MPQAPPASRNHAEGSIITSLSPRPRARRDDSAEPDFASIMAMQDGAMMARDGVATRVTDSGEDIEEPGSRSGSSVTASAEETPAAGLPETQGLQPTPAAGSGPAVVPALVPAAMPAVNGLEAVGARAGLVPPELAATTDQDEIVAVAPQGDAEPQAAECETSDSVSIADFASIAPGQGRLSPASTPPATSPEPASAPANEADNTATSVIAAVTQAESSDQSQNPGGHAPSDQRSFDRGASESATVSAATQAVLVPPVSTAATDAPARAGDLPAIRLPLSPEEARGLAAEFAKAARNYLATGRGNLSFRLRPPELGDLRLTIHVIGNVTRVDVVVERREAVDLLRAQMSELAGGLRDQGLTLGGVEVTLGDPSRREGGAWNEHDGTPLDTPAAMPETPSRPRSGRDDTTITRMPGGMRATHLDLRA